MDTKIVYYKDELNDEFSGDDIKPRRIDEKYKYVSHNPFKYLTHIFWYRIFINPIAHIYLITKFRFKMVGKENLKKVKGGYFMYGNHTHNLVDAFSPTMISGWKDTYLLVNPSNVSIKGLGNITHSMGALPLPDDLKATRNFVNAIEYYSVKKKCAIGIYPEAHIWPYCTWIRNYKDASFRYPVDYNLPVFAITTTYQKRKKNKIRVVTYIDGPYYPNPELSKKDARKELRDIVYNKQVERSKLNEVELVKYVKDDRND